jgi:hypothetical protein
MMRIVAASCALLCVGCASGGDAEYSGWTLVEEEAAYGAFYRIRTTEGFTVCEPNTDSRHILIVPIDGTPCHRLSKKDSLIEVTGWAFVLEDEYDTLDGFVAYNRDRPSVRASTPQIVNTETVRYEQLFADELEAVVVTDHFADGRYTVQAFAMLPVAKGEPFKYTAEYDVKMTAYERDRTRSDALMMKVLRAIEVRFGRPNAPSGK